MKSLNFLLALNFVAVSALALQENTLTSAERVETIARAQVWRPIDTKSLNLLQGQPFPGAPSFLETLTCNYITRAEKEVKGASRKFYCRTTQGKTFKIKYGVTNGEVYGEVLSTRLLWALGFGADAVYPVRVRCLDCPADPWKNEKNRAERVFEPAIVELKFKGETLETKEDEGFSLKDLRLLNPELEASSTEERDALKLLLAFIQHVDNRAANQRLVCLEDGFEFDVASGKSICRRPFIVIQDAGSSFGRSGLTAIDRIAKARLDMWSSKSIWKKNTKQCRANLRSAINGSLESNPKISEAGRALLARLLNELSDEQIRDLFVASQIELRDPNPIDAWVAEFKSKVSQITDRKCKP